MNEIFYIIVIVFLVLACGWYKIVVRLEEGRNNKLQEQLDVLMVKHNHLKCQLRKKKELLEIQDKLISTQNDDILEANRAIEILSNRK